MNCRTAIRTFSSALDGRLPLAERRLLDEHLADCPDCSLSARELADLTDSLRDIPSRPVPPELSTALRVAVSQELRQRARRASLRATMEYWGDLARLWAHSLMRPFALPVVGGSLLSAVFVLTLLAPMYVGGGFQAARAEAPRDVPTLLTRPATLRSSNSTLGFITTDIVVDVWIDGTGRLIDYAVPPGQTWGLDQDLRRSIENALLCTQFEPAMMFGQPKSGKLRIKLSQDQVEVKG